MTCIIFCRHSRSIESPCSFKSSHIRLQLRVEHWSTVSWRHQKEDVLFEISKKMRGQLLAVAMAASYPHPSLQNHKKSIYDSYHHNICRGLSAIKTLCNCVCFGYIEEISLFMLFPRGFLRHCSLAMNMEKELI